eukprot:2429881-Rhodomonas_salina.1
MALFLTNGGIPRLLPDTDGDIRRAKGRPPRAKSKCATPGRAASDTHKACLLYTSPSPRDRG